MSRVRMLGASFALEPIICSIGPPGPCAASDGPQPFDIRLAEHNFALRPMLSLAKSEERVQSVAYAPHASLRNRLRNSRSDPSLLRR